MPDDIADTFADFCASVGISQNAAVEAGVRGIVQRYIENQGRPLDQWSEDAVGPMAPYVDLARQLDTERRRGTKRPE